MSLCDESRVRFDALNWPGQESQGNMMTWDEMRRESREKVESEAKFMRHKCRSDAMMRCQNYMA